MRHTSFVLLVCLSFECEVPKLKIFSFLNVTCTCMYVTKSSCSASTTTTQTHLFHTLKTWKYAAYFLKFVRTNTQNRLHLLQTRTSNVLPSNGRGEQGWSRRKSWTCVGGSDCSPALCEDSKQEWSIFVFQFCFLLNWRSTARPSDPFTSQGRVDHCAHCSAGGICFFSITVFVNNFVRIGSRLEF